jgi:hypothetical protein
MGKSHLLHSDDVGDSNGDFRPIYHKNEHLVLQYSHTMSESDYLL